MLGKLAVTLGGCLGIIAALAVALGISWILTCGFVFLITLCFGLTYSWMAATGVWLVLLLLCSVFNTNTGNK